LNEIETVGVEAALPDGVQEADSAAPVKGERPWIFGLLIAPSAATANGVIQGGVLAYLLSLQHVGSGGQSHLIALLGIPTWPITDFFVRRRTWLLIGGLGAGALMAAAFHEPHLTARGSVVLMFLSACLSQLVVSSCGGMMAALRSDASKRGAGSYYQAGSMGFGALSAWMLVYMSARVSTGTLGWLAGAVIGLPALTALWAPAQPNFGEGRFGDSVRRVGVEFKATFWNVRAIPYLLCMVFPGGSGAAIALLPSTRPRPGPRSAARSAASRKNR
jgi:PAT family beta-lactamase induction signal transducer AmpG